MACVPDPAHNQTEVREGAHMRMQFGREVEVLHLEKTESWQSE